jgi:hypothetical protein
MAEQQDTIQPIVIDLGKVGRRAIKDLKIGRGRLIQEVSEALAMVRLNMADEIRGKQLVPVVFLYRKKIKKSGFSMPFNFQ